VRTIDDFVLRSSAPNGLCVCHRSRPLEVPVPGSVLEAQLELDDDAGFLLLLTDDRPYEETLHVVLLDHDGHEIERLELGRPYTPGLFSGMEIVAPTVLGFRFFSGLVHELEILPRPRGFLRRRRLRLRARPTSTRA
jgi:hypothetical protein